MVFKLNDSDYVLEDVVGSFIFIIQVVGVVGQLVKIDIIVFVVLILVLLVDLLLIDGWFMFSCVVVIIKGFSVKVEVGSMIEVIVKSFINFDSSGYIKSVIVIGELQNILFMDDDLIRIGSMLFCVIVKVIDVVGNVSFLSVVQIFGFDFMVFWVMVQSLFSDVVNGFVIFNVSFDEVFKNLLDKENFMVINGIVIKVEKVDGIGGSIVYKVNLVKEGVFEWVVDVSGLVGLLFKGVEQFVLWLSVLIVCFCFGIVDLSLDEVKCMNEIFIKYFEWNVSFEQNFIIFFVVVEGLLEFNCMVFYWVVVVCNYLLFIGVFVVCICQCIELVLVVCQFGMEGLEICIQKIE